LNGYDGKVGEGCSRALEACLKTIQEVTFVCAYTHPLFYAFLFLTPLANYTTFFLRSLILGLTPFVWLHSITVTP
jgi:hypothetical protein